MITLSVYGSKGVGVALLGAVKEESFIGEYVGEVISSVEYRAREQVLWILVLVSATALIDLLAIQRAWICDKDRKG